MQYCSLQHQTLLPSPVTSTTGWCFCFGSISSFFLELFLHCSPVAYLGTYRPGEFIFQCPIFLSLHTVHGVLKARILKWFDIPFSSRSCFVRILYHGHQSWVALHSMAHSFTELDKAVVHVISLIQFSSVAESCLTLCDPMSHSTPGLPVHHQFPVFTQTHVR